MFLNPTPTQSIELLKDVSAIDFIFVREIDQMASK